MLVSPATARRWQRLLQRETTLTAFEAEAVALGWASWRRIGGRDLVGEVRRFKTAGFTTGELVQWMSVGFGESDAESGDAWDATPEQWRWLYQFMGDGESQIATSGRGFEYLAEGVPPGLLCLLFWAGCDTVTDFETHLGEWRSGGDIEPGLRLLAALSYDGLPIPELDAPPKFPYERAVSG